MASWPDILRTLLTLGCLAMVPPECRCVRSSSYVKLIKDVHRLYQTSCVFFTQSGTFEDIELTTLMHNWSHEFSKMGVLSMATTFPNTPNTIRNYSKRIGRPLFIVALNGQKTVEEFGNVTSEISQDSTIVHPTWFVIFIRVRGTKPHENFCKSPTGNPFHLKFNTIMLVLCYDLPILREWYSLQDNLTRTFDYAIWEPQLGHLKVLTKMNIYYRRANMFNETLRIITPKGSNLVSRVNNELTGPFGALFTELSRTLNFSMTIIELQEPYGSWSQARRLWTGIVGRLVRDEADIGLAGFTMSNKRLDAVDFTLPLIHSRNRIYIRQPGGAAVRWAAYFQAFDYKIWTIVILLLISSPMMLTWMKGHIKPPIRRHKPRCTFLMLSESYTRVWGLYCQQGLIEFSNRDSLRVAYLSLSVTALILYNAYSAALISFLTVFVPSMPFTSLEGFVKDGSYKLIVYRDSAQADTFKAASENIFAKALKLMKNNSELPYTSAEGFKQICREKTAFYTSESIGWDTLDKDTCKTVFIETGRVESLAIILTKNNPYKELINYHLQVFIDNGILDRIRDSQPRRREIEEKKHPSVDVWSVEPILTIALAGLVLALTILALEVLFSLMKSDKRRPADQGNKFSRNPQGRNTSLMSKQAQEGVP